MKERAGKQQQDHSNQPQRIEDEERTREGTYYRLSFPNNSKIIHFLMTREILNQLCTKLPSKPTEKHALLGSKNKKFCRLMIKPNC
ncbi:hypothetical protein QJS04_geneDACA007350 [Acorus gramineus]|uniref:Uncharacterized protein n=1 Tax=Acorus gramineus TaxID=55184 RepID=A0AAV9BMY0_ACOGR|nr:hypothetical protein QJS04_geneDACA007350 [Acorus gramineus]